MTYMELVQLIADFAFIQVVESAFMVIMVMLLSRIKLNVEKTIISIAICSIASTLLIPFGQNDVLPRLIFVAIIGVTILVVNECNIKKLLNIYTSLFVTTVIMMIIGFIGFVPFAYILGQKISILQENIFLMIVCSIPTRVLEYVVCYLTFMRIGGKFEKNN